MCVLDCGYDSYDNGYGECVPYVETCAADCAGVETTLTLDGETYVMTCEEDYTLVNNECLTPVLVCDE